MFMAVTGISEKMVRHYTARANQFRLASKAQLKREKQNVPKTECSNIGSCTVQTPVAEARKATRNRLLASWRSGDAADCKSVYTGSIPVLASTSFQTLTSLLSVQRLGRLHLRLQFSRLTTLFRGFQSGKNGITFIRTHPCVQLYDLRSIAHRPSHKCRDLAQRKVRIQKTRCSCAACIC